MTKRRDRVIRGSSWCPLAGNIRAANRHWFPPGDRSGHLGFRIAKDVDEREKVARGGSWYGSAGGVRVANRAWNWGPTRRYGRLGFRIAADMEENMGYEPNDCELGICGPGEGCREQEDPDRLLDERDEGACRGNCATCEDEEAQVSVTKKTPIGYIDLTPSWVSVVGIYLEVIETSYDPGKRADARSEILRAARLADLYVKEHKKP